MEKISENKILTHAICLLLIVYTIFKTYGVNGIRISEIADYILIFFYLVNNELSKNALPIILKRYFCFWAFSIVVSCIWTGVNGLRPLFGLIHVYLLFSMFYSKTDVNLLIKYYRIIALICISFFYIQEVAYVRTGMRMSGVIPGLPVMNEFGSGAELAQIMQYSQRSSSFFSEPAHFVQFLLPLLCIELFYADDKKHLIRSGVIILTLLLLQSGNAIVGLATVFVVYLYKNLTGRSIMRNLLLASVTLLVGFFALAYYLQSEKGSALLGRQDQLSATDYESGQSGFLRIYRGYFVYDNLDPIEKVIGVNEFQTLRRRIDTSKVGYMFRENDTYFNVIQDLLIRTGIIGLIIFFLYCFALIKNSSYTTKALVLSFIALCFVSALFFTPTMALFLVLASRLKDFNIPIGNSNTDISASLESK